MFKKLRNYFFTGLIVTLPLAGTVFFAVWLYGFFKGLIPFSLFKNVPYGEILIESAFFQFFVVIIFLLLLVLIFVIMGFISTNIIGKSLLEIIRRIFNKIPILRTIYNTLSQLFSTLIRPDNQSFKTLVLVEYPRKGIYSLGFLTSDSPVSFNEKTGKKLVNVFIPTTPNPTSGLLILVPEEDIIKVDISVEEGMKFIISAGVIKS